MHHRSTRLAALAVAAALLVAGCGGDDESSSDTAAAADTTAPAETTPPATEVPATDAPTTTEAAGFEGELVGTFAIDAAVCDGPEVSGSYFKMVQPGGTPADGPFIPNTDSPCVDPSFTALSPGADGGLVTGAFQAAPEPPYDAAGNGIADLITTPAKFFGVDFATATDPAGTQPTVTATDGVLSGDLSAFTAFYGGASFNQGAPKPDGSGEAPTGTIDPATGAFVLEWTSLIVGGSFDGFLGVWHLEGTFAPN